MNNVTYGSVFYMYSRFLCQICTILQGKSTNGEEPNDVKSTNREQDLNMEQKDTNDHQVQDKDKE